MAKEKEISLMDKASRFDKINKIMSDKFDIEDNGLVLQEIASVFFDEKEQSTITEEQTLECIKELFAQTSSSNALIQSYVSLKKGIEQLYVEQMENILP